MESVRPPDASGKGTSRARLVVIVVAVVVVVSVLGGAAWVVFLGQPRSSGPVIKIGFTIALTGRLSLEGNAALNGIQTAIAWVNDHGGVTVNGTAYDLEPVFYDDNSVSENINTWYSRLVQQDGAHFLLAPYSSSLTTAAAPFADQLDRVMMSHGGASDVLWTKGYKNLVGVLSPATAYLKTAVDTLNATNPDAKIAVLHEGDPFSKVAAPAAATYAEAKGLEVVYQAEYPSTGTTDLRPQLTAARERGATALIGGGHFNDGLLIMTGLGQINWVPNFISLLVAVPEPTFQSQLQARANRVTGPSQWEAAVSFSPELATQQSVAWYGPTQTQFVDLYKNRTEGKSPSYHAAEAAAAILVLAEAIGRADSLETAAVRQVLGDMTLMTFFGDYDVDATGIQIAHDVVLTQWQGGVLKIVAPADAADGTFQYPYTGT